MAFSAKEKLEKLLEFVNKEEGLRTEFPIKAMEKGNIMAMQIHNAKACACTKMRYSIEDMLSHKKVAMRPAIQIKLLWNSKTALKKFTADSACCNMESQSQWVVTGRWSRFPYAHLLITISDRQTGRKNQCTWYRILPNT